MIDGVGDELTYVECGILTAPEDRPMEQRLGENLPTLSGSLSGTLDAGQALEDAGFSEVAHVVHGFEGELNEDFKRSSLNGWRHDGLPWEQC